MEQYEICPSRFWQEISKALEYFVPSHILIRQIGSQGGKTRVREELTEKRLTIVKPKQDLHIMIDGLERFIFEADQHVTSRCKGLLKWSVAYERIYPPTPECPLGRMHHAGTGYPNPNDSSLPPITETILRCGNETHFMQITFPGKIPITRTHQPTKKRCWAYWKIIAPEKKRDASPRQS